MLSLQPLKSSGFTLIELIVVIGLMGLVLASGIAGYRTFYNRQQVLQAAQEMITVLRAAQKKASVGDKPAGCLVPLRLLEGYDVRFSTYDTYYLRVRCSAEYRGAINTYTLPSGVVFESNFGEIIFPTIQNGAIQPATEGSITIKTQGTSGYTYTITVLSSGAVQEGSLSAFP